MNTEQYKIIHLPKEQWKNVIIPMRYTTEEYFDVKMEKIGDSFRVDFVKTKLEEPVSHYPEEYDFPDKLYQDHWEKAMAWGIVEENESKQELMACIETCPEDWSNRLIITELWVHKKLRRKGIGHALMELAKQQANSEHRRAIILETQSCNVSAISFYLQEGFELIGFDSCCYSNRDVDKKEVRLDFGYFPEKMIADKAILEKFEFRNIKQDETNQAVVIEQVCFPPNEACSEKNMKDRIATAPELFLVAIDKKTGKLAGFLNGIATDECAFRDEFFTNAGLHNPQGKNIMLLGLDVLPEYRRQGLGRELVYQYLRREREKGREEVFLTCLQSKVKMYQKFGFMDRGIADSTWGGEEWHEMSCKIGMG